MRGAANDYANVPMVVVVVVAIVMAPAVVIVMGFLFIEVLVLPIVPAVIDLNNICFSTGVANWRYWIGIRRSQSR